MAIYSKKKLIILLLSCTVFLAGVSVIIGWQFDIVALKSIMPGLTNMNPVTAITFILCSFSVPLSTRYPKFRHIVTILSIFITLVGVIHFVTYIFPFPAIRFDHLFFTAKMLSNPAPNLIAPNTALTFTLAGVSMLLVNAHNKTAQVYRQGIILFALAIVYVSIMGYLYDIKYAYGYSRYTPMALNTAFVFLVLCIALFLCDTRYSLARTITSKLRGGRMLRITIPFLFIMPMAVGYMRVIGEKKGLYPSEFGAGINTFIFAVVELIIVTLYASAENKRHMHRIKSELQLSKSEHRFRALFNALTEGVMSISTQGIIKYCNPGFCNITGYTENEIAGKNAISIFVSEKEREEAFACLKNSSGRSDEGHEIELYTKEGSKIWVKIKITILDHNNEISNTRILTITDITEEKIKVEDLKAFTASAAHDLNSPLARIIMAIDAFDTHNLDDDQKMLLSAINDTSASMRQLLKDLLTFSRLGTVRLEKGHINIARLVRRVCENEIPKEFGGEILIHDLPDVLGNGPAVQQLFTNLISNAVKYSSKNDHPVVEIGTFNEFGRTIYYVKDNGIGISESNIENLFTPFRRFDTRFEGNGMGLAIVKRIVENHGGIIWAESVKGQQTTFLFSLGAGNNWNDQHSDQIHDVQEAA